MDVHVCKNVSIKIFALSLVRLSRHFGRVMWLHILEENDRWQEAGNPDDESDTQKGFLQGYVK